MKDAVEVLAQAVRRDKQCLALKCQEDHPQWVYPEFKKLAVSHCKELIVKTGQCVKRLAAVQLSKDCKRGRKCAWHQRM